MSFVSFTADSSLWRTGEETKHGRSSFFFSTLLWTLDHLPRTPLCACLCACVKVAVYMAHGCLRRACFHSVGSNGSSGGAPLVSLPSL